MAGIVATENKAKRETGINTHTHTGEEKPGSCFIFSVNTRSNLKSVIDNTCTLRQKSRRYENEIQNVLQFNSSKIVDDSDSSDDDILFTGKFSSKLRQRRQGSC